MFVFLSRKYPKIKFNQVREDTHFFFNGPTIGFRDNPSYALGKPQKKSSSTSGRATKALPPTPPRA